jgi:hypothetical protein
MNFIAVTCSSSVKFASLSLGGKVERCFRELRLSHNELKFASRLHCVQNLVCNKFFPASFVQTRKIINHISNFIIK